MKRKLADHSHFLRAGEDGHIWWSVDDALKLAAGFIPGGDDPRVLAAHLQAPSQRVAADHRRLMGALDDDRFTFRMPSIVQHGGVRYVEAREFLEWLSQYLAQTQSRILFPSALARDVRDAAVATAEDSIAQPPYELLASVLQGWFDKSFAELPAALQQRMIGVPMLWDGQTPERRRNVVQQLDCQRDPNKAQQWQQWWRLRTERTEVIATSAVGFDERARKNARVAELDGQLAAVWGGPDAGLAPATERWSDFALWRLLEESSELGMTQAKLGSKYGVSRQRISTLLAQAQKKFGRHAPSLAETGVLPQSVKRKKK